MPAGRRRRVTQRRAIRLAGLRSKLRDSRYLERAIRYLAQLLIDGTSRAPRE